MKNSSFATNMVESYLFCRDSNKKIIIGYSVLYAYRILVLLMNYISILFIGLYYLYVVERIVIGRFLIENSLDTYGIKESFFGNGFLYHLWSTGNLESEYMYVINTGYYHYLPVRQLKSFRYLI